MKQFVLFLMVATPALCDKSKKIAFGRRTSKVTIKAAETTPKETVRESRDALDTVREGREAFEGFIDHGFKSSFGSGAPSFQASYHSTPSYSQPSTYHEPAPAYNQQTHNCTVLDETVRAQVCLPSFTQECEQVQVTGSDIVDKEKCLSITRTVCSESTEQASVNICRTQYEPKDEEADATSVDVTFNKECSKQMVTVCQPASGYGSSHYGGYNKGSYQHCKEVAQETCYNKPSVQPKTVKVTVTVPNPVQDCSPRQVSLPTITCEDITEERCVSLPSVEEAQVTAMQCKAKLGAPQCKPIELVLPKQVCQELLYGYASKPKAAPPTYTNPAPVTYTKPAPVTYSKPAPPPTYSKPAPPPTYN